MRRSVRWGAAVVAVVLVVACGDGDGGGPEVSGDTIPPITDDPPSTTTEADGSEPSPTEPAADTPDLNDDAVVSVDDGAAPGEVRALVRSIAVGETAAYAGFTIEVASVEVGFDPAGIPVAEIRVGLTNRTPRADRLQTAVEIESAGVVAPLDRDGTPEVPAGGTAEGFFSVRLGASFAFSDAVLAIGRPDRQRITIPLGATGELVNRLPTVHDSPGTASVDGTSIDVASVTVGWDTVDPRAQAEPGQRFVTVDYVLDSAVATAVNDDTVSLRDASGETWTPIDATVQSVDAGLPTELVAVFAVTEPVPDELVLAYVERFGNGAVDVPLDLG